MTLSNHNVKLLKVLSFSFILSFGSPCSASTMAVMVMSRGIVAVSDGEVSAVARCSAVSAQRKMHTIHDRLLIVTAGITRLSICKGRIAARGRHKPLPKWVSDFPSYEFDSWVRDIEKSTPASIAISTLANLVKERSAGIFVRPEMGRLLNDFTAQGREQFGNGVVLFMIAGYENSVATVYVVRIGIDWTIPMPTTPTMERVHPKAGRPNDWFYYQPEGLANVVMREIEHPASPAYKRIASQAEAEIALLEARKDLSLVQAERLLYVLVSEEIRANSSAVSLPILVGTAPKQSPASITRYDTLSTAPKAKRQKREKRTTRS